MNIATKASSLYGGARDFRSPRDLEYEIFSRVTRQLQAALNPPEGSHSGPDTRVTARLASALHENNRLWIVLSGDLADAGNGLPPELRAGLLSLASFSLAESGRILSGDGGELQALIDVNTAVMRGLRSTGPGA